MRRWAFALLLALGACSNRPGYALSQRPDDAPRVRDPGYYDVLERYTAYESGYDGLDHRFYLAATWESWAFRQRRIAALASFLSLPPGEVEAMRLRERAEAAQFVDFFIGLYTAESRWNDLSSPRTIWRLELELPDGETVLPARVERILRPNANVQALYGYLTPFWAAYRVRFPATDADGRPVVREGGTLQLRLTSAVGSAAPVWTVAPGDLPPPAAPPPAGTVAPGERPPAAPPPAGIGAPVAVPPADPPP